MKTKLLLNTSGRSITLAITLVLAASAAARADDATIRPSGSLSGLYKVTSSNDPLFPASKTREYFLDFGQGIQPNRLSGNVAVSERQNPRVRVRIMAWQYFPDQRQIVIGNTYYEGSRNAVVKGAC